MHSPYAPLPGYESSTVIDRTSPIIKIDGFRDVIAARAAVAAGAGAIGFILAPSRRQISPESIAAILGELSAGRPPVVGVFVNESPGAIDDIVRVSGVDVIQLAGDELPSILDRLDYSVWKALRFEAGTTIDEASRIVELWLSPSRPVKAVLVDAAVPGSYGGSGHVADWDLAARLAETYPVILAGGLTPANVAGAIESVRPIGVDVSSGVEVDGSKDPGLIQAFIEESLRAFALAG